MRTAWGAAVFAVLIFSAGNTATQTARPSSGQKQAHSEKTQKEAFRRAVADFLTQQSQLQQQANAAFKREMARKKAGDCPDARTTYDEVTCLSRSIQTTETNYKIFSGAIRALLSQKNPFVSNTETFVGPTGKPLSAQDLAREFDRAETGWEAYRKTQCGAAYDLFKGGTIAPVMDGRCELTLIRSRMADLNSIYSMTLRH